MDRRPWGSFWVMPTVRQEAPEPQRVPGVPRATGNVSGVTRRVPGTTRRMTTGTAPHAAPRKDALASVRAPRTDGSAHPAGRHDGSWTL
ncbi:hypothetical protein GCM10028832_46360 [Streptomyces sparsus]